MHWEGEGIQAIPQQPRALNKHTLNQDIMHRSSPMASAVQLGKSDAHMLQDTWIAAV
jgi:hypothetical protein